MKIVACVGIAVHDVIFSLTSLPSGPGKHHATGRIEVGGGVAANAAVAVSRLGGQPRYIGPLGEDDLGEIIIRDLNAGGVDTKRVRRIHGVTSPLSSIVVGADGERLVVNHADAGLFEQAEEITDRDMDGSEAVLVDVRWVEGATAALDWAIRHGVPGLLDYDVGNRPARNLLDLASHVVFSAAALGELTGKSDLEQGLRAIAEETPAWLAVTAGAEGTYWIEGEAIAHLPAFEVPVVDTTGAGDVYHGALAWFLAGDKTHMRNAIEFASAAAALTCTTFGGRTGIPSGEEIRAFLEERE
jgi:sulfofructose kinase